MSDLPGVPPQDLVAEENVLGACLLSEKAISTCAKLLQPGDFYRSSHGAIFKAIVDLHERGVAVDAITVTDELRKRSKLADVGGEVRINELAALVPAASNVAHWARIVREVAVRRTALAQLTRAIATVESGGAVEEIAAVLDEARAVLPNGSGLAAPLPTVPLSTIEPKSIHFLDRPLWQASGFHLCVGRKGVGKGTALADLAARFTLGRLGARRGVLWISSEDDAGIDIHPRVIAAGGDPARIHVVTDWLQLPRDLDRLRATIHQLGDVGLAIIDPVGNHITGKDSNAETDVRDAIAPLNHLSDETETLLVGVRHLSEKEAGRGVLAAVLGNSAWVQVPRAVLAVVRDDEDPALSHVQVVAGNRLPPGTAGRVFRIEGVALPGLASEVTRAVWVGDSVKDAETLLSAGRRTSKSAAARQLILDLLERAPGNEIESDALDAQVAQETGLAAQTIKNIRTELRDAGLIKSRPEKDEGGQVNRWIVQRTHAPRPDTHPAAETAPPAPTNGSNTPDTRQSPYTQQSVSGYPDTDSGCRDLGRYLDDHQQQTVPQPPPPSKGAGPPKSPRER